MILDVVYNHLGPGSEAFEAFGPYLTDRYGTPWGDAVNFDDRDCGGVREWALQNACMWVRDYRIDGLRVDAVHAIHDSGARHVLAELCARVATVSGGAAVTIAESDLNDPRVVSGPERGGWGFDAQWSDDFHHALHALLTGERDGYYADYAASGRPGDRERRGRSSTTAATRLPAQAPRGPGDGGAGRPLRGRALRTTTRWATGRSASAPPRPRAGSRRCG